MVLAAWALAASPGGSPTERSSTDLSVVASGLGVDERLLRESRQALELVYERRYPELPARLEALDATWPGSGAAPFGRVVLYQARMFENFDFAYEAPYRSAYTEGVGVLQEAAREPGAEGWEHFLLAALHGVDAIHAMRRGSYVLAATRALQAVDQIADTRALAPDLGDLALGDGLYLYWRTVAANRSVAIPRFADRQEEGLDLLRHAEAEAVLVGPPASLALAWSWLEERRYREAAERCEAVRVRYPDNLLNLLALGRIYTAMGRLTDALALYDHVREAFPENRWVLLEHGIALSRAGRYDEAKRSLEAYVAAPGNPPEPVGKALYRIGGIELHLGDRAAAAAAWRRAVDASGDADARRALQRWERYEESP